MWIDYRAVNQLTMEKLTTQDWSPLSQVDDQCVFVSCLGALLVKPHAQSAIEPSFLVTKRMEEP